MPGSIVTMGRVIVAVSTLYLTPSFGQTYLATALPGLGGQFTVVKGINRAGAVVGYSINSSYVTHAALWNRTEVTELKTLGGSLSFATAVNSSGQVAGYSDTEADATTVAAIWNAEKGSNQGSLGGSLSYAYGINDAGEAVGASTITIAAQHYTHATLWKDGTAIDLATLGGIAGSVRGSSATGINATGQIVGFSDTPASTAQHATLWKGTTAIDLGTLGGDSSAAYGINAAGLIVGQADLPDDTAAHAALWTDTMVTDLGTLGGSMSAAFGINAANEVVGTSQTSKNAQHATLWSAGKVLDLNTLVRPALPPYVTLTVAVAINDSGQIAVYGNDSRTGGTDAFLLTPSP